MLKTLASSLTLLLLLLCVSASDSGFPRCNCDDEGSLWSLDSILECQRVSDFLIAVAYFSIPIELLYFISCSNVPFKWVLFQFIAFIVLCGLTHLLNGWTYGAHPFQLMLALTVFKILTALVSCATAITLITFIPLLLKVKVREIMLKRKTWDLGREVGIIMKQREAGLHVRMLTQEIRKSLDRHEILNTTMFELSQTLGLLYCSVWMPNEQKTEMNLTHELKGRTYSNRYNTSNSIPITDPDVVRIKGSDNVNILRCDSLLVVASTGDSGEAGPAAAIRMPMLRVSNFKGGTPEMVPTYYAILLLVLPGGEIRSWSNQELEIIKVVADQVAVALSHAALLEESQLMREKLAEQNRDLQQARRNAMMASQARNSFQKVMSDGMRKPMHSVLGLISMLQDENLSNNQRVIIDAMSRTSNVVTTLINDVMDNSKGSGRFPLEIRSLSLHAVIKEAACLAKCLSVYRGFGFSIEVDSSLPDHIMGDERRFFQVILHMVGNLLNGSKERGGCVVFRVSQESGSFGRNDQQWANWRRSSSEIYVRFEIGIIYTCVQTESSVSNLSNGIGLYTSGSAQELSFTICRKLVQLMQGNIWVVPNPEGFTQSLALVLRFQLQASISIPISEPGNSTEHLFSNSQFRALQILLADTDDVNRVVTRKLLEKLGCIVTSVSSGFDCLTTIGPASSSIQVVLLDLQMFDLDSFEVAIRIRKFRSQNHSTPLIIGLTASADGDIWERCVQSGINGLMRKPINLQGIANELRRVLLQANKHV